MNNTKTHKCHRCGYKWKHGMSGEHNCAEMLAKKLAEYEERMTWKFPDKTLPKLGDRVSFYVTGDFHNMRHGVFKEVTPKTVTKRMFVENRTKETFFISEVAIWIHSLPETPNY